MLSLTSARFGLMARSRAAFGKFEGTLPTCNKSRTMGMIKYEEDGVMKKAYLHASELKQKGVKTANGNVGYKQIMADYGRYSCKVPAEFRKLSFDLKNEGKEMMRAINVTLAGSKTYPQTSYMEKIAGTA